MELGERIREIRENLNISISELAKRTGLTSSLISQVERDLASPSVSTLKKIAKALNLPMSKFFNSEPFPLDIVVRNDKRRRLQLPNSHLVYELLSPNFTCAVQLLITKIEPGAESSDVPQEHSGEECALVLGGKVEFTVGNEVHVLDDGDCIYIENGVSHKLVNIGDTEITLISAISPPGF